MDAGNLFQTYLKIYARFALWNIWRRIFLFTPNCLHYISQCKICVNALKIFFGELAELVIVTSTAHKHDKALCVQ